MATMRARALVWVGLMGCAALGAGCAMLEKPAPEAGRMARTDYSDAFSAGRYGDAYVEASEAAEQAAPGRKRDEAALIAGLSADRLNQETNAERWLEPLTRSNERDIAGRAGAALGLREQARGRHSRAAELFSEAADRLTGDEAARAEFHAGQSCAALGKPELARMKYAAAAAHATDPTFRGRVQREMNALPVGAGADRASAFSVQLGAFSRLENAEECVRRHSAAAGREGLGLPWIDQRADDGRTLYVVRVGRFPARDQASAAKRAFPGSTVAGVETTP